MKKKGAALLVVIIVMMLTFLLATIMFETSIKHLKVSNDALDNTNAYYCAETGLYDAINHIERMVKAGSFNKGYYAYDIPINNLYSKGENYATSNLYLFGDVLATYQASIRLAKIENDEQDVTINGKTVTVSTPLIEKKFNCKINSKGTYNNQNHLINDTVNIYYDTSIYKWTYSFETKLSTKD